MIYLSLTLLGQTTAITPGNVTPVYPAAGFAMACVLIRGPGVWPGIWLGQLLGNTWAFIDVSNASSAVATSSAGVLTGCGAAAQALIGAYLIQRLCGTADVFNRLRHLFTFAGVATIACWISALWVSSV